MKALLIWPPVYDFAFYDLFHKPYGLLRIARWLQHSGWEISFLNAMDYQDDLSRRILGPPNRKKNGTGKLFRQPAPLPPEAETICRERQLKRRFSRYGVHPDSLARQMKELKKQNSTFDLVCISTGMTYWYPGVREMVNLSRHFFPEAFILAGGTYAALMPRHCRQVCGVDAALPGGHRELLAFFKHKNWPAADFPASLVPLTIPSFWKDAGVLRLNYGCPYHCDYCASQILCRGYHSGNLQSITLFFEELYRQGIRNFAFYDDALLARKEELLQPFLQHVITHFPGCSFYVPNALHMEWLEDHTLSLMLQAGFREIRIGFESADEDFHRRHDGKLNPSRLDAFAQLLDRHNFPRKSVSCYILAGLPGQHWKEVERTLNFVAARNLQPRIAEYSPVPRTSWWKESCRTSPYPLAREPLFHNNTFFPLEHPQFTRQDLQFLKKKSFSG